MNYDYDALAAKATDELTADEAQALAYFRSTISQRENEALAVQAEAPAEAPAPAKK